MTNTLKVIRPFMAVEENDVFEKTEDGLYDCSYSTDETIVNTSNISDYVYNSSFKITEDYAQTLINLGYLEEVKESKQSFVNVFDEIDNLYTTYASELENLDKDLKGSPACLKIEKQTVLENLMKVLAYLQSLKK